MSKKKQEIIDAVIDFVKIKGDYPSKTELLDMYDITFSMLRHSFGTMQSLKEQCYEQVEEHLGKVSYYPKAPRELTLKEKAIYIITSHQNNTKPHKKFLDSLLQLKTHLNAKLIVVPVFYQTRLAHQYKIVRKNGKRKKIYTGPKWSEELNDYYRSRPIKLNGTLELCAGLNINATATDPLSGLEALTGISSSIFAHPQLRCTYVASPSGTPAKVMLTTGSVSQINYTRTKAGAKGAFHHTNSAVVVYVDGDDFWHYTVNADHVGNFYHHEYKYTSAGYEKIEKGYSLVCGDLHCEYMDPDVEGATWSNKGSIVDILPIEKQVFHDVIDFSIEHSHHNVKNVIYRHLLKKKGTASAEWSLSRTVKVLIDLMAYSADKTTKYYMISSNHHDHVFKFLNNVNLKDLDEQDQTLYLSLMTTLFAEGSLDSGGNAHNVDPFKIFCRNAMYPEQYNQIEWVGRNDHVTIQGVDISQHGDVGPNGGPGGAIAFAKTNYKSVIGHSHTPGIRFGVYQVGVSSYLQRGYNAGYSSWAHVHCIIYPNGKRTLIPIVNGLWRPFARG